MIGTVWDKKKSERGEMIELLIIHEIVWVNLDFLFQLLNRKIVSLIEPL